MTSKKKSKFAKKDYTEAERGEMFIYWVKNNSVRRTAIHYKCAESTIYRMKKSDNWEDRRNEVLKKLRSKLDTKAATAVAQKVRITKAIHAKVAATLLSKENKIEPTVSDYVRISKYLDELEGDAPKAQRSDIVIEVIGRIESGESGYATRIINNALGAYCSIDDKADQRLSKIFVSGFSTPN